MRQIACKGSANLRHFNGCQPSLRHLCLLRLSRLPDTVNRAPLGFPSNSRPTLQLLAGQEGLVLVFLLTRGHLSEPRRVFALLPRGTLARGEYAPAVLCAELSNNPDSTDNK